MKLQALALLTFSLMISTSSFATHAYRGEDCKSSKLELNYLGNYPVGGDYKISLLGSEDGAKALPLEEGEGTNTLADAEVIFQEVSSKNIGSKETISECGFDHEEWKSKKSIKIKAISKAAGLKLGLKKGDKIQMVCDETFDMPNGKDCE